MFSVLSTRKDVLKGRADRISAIHAAYGLAWAVLAYVERPALVTILLLGAGVLVALLSLTRLTSGSPRMPVDRSTSRSILRINVATGVAIVGAILLTRALHADRHLVPAILVVMAIHFIPLWRLLGHPSLAVMSAALATSAMIGLSNMAGDVAPLLASVIFMINGGRLAMHA